jgi:surface polysaccharide O-acyltransferase-like enzyme
VKSGIQKNSINNSRLIGVDFIRVIAMLMVLVLHTIISFTMRPDFFATKLWFVVEPISAISKPAVLLFFMMSGFLVINKSRTIQENWKKTKKRIFIPLCFFSILNIIYAFSNFHYNGSNGVEFLQSQLVRVTNFPSSPLWFLVVLLFLYLLNPVWQTIFGDSKNRNLGRYLVLLSFIFSAIVTIIKFPSLKNDIFYNNFTAWLGFLFFYLYGGLVRNNWININNNKINTVLVIFSFIAIMIGDYFTAFANVYNLNFIWNGYTFDYLSIPVILLSVGLFNILIRANYRWISENNAGRKFLQGLKWLAGLSFGIYLIHSYVVSIFTDKIGFDFNKITINVYLYNILNYSLVLTISLIITYIIKKTPKFRMVIGE